MKLYLIRHGKTLANEQHLYCGSTDLPLSERGVAELQQKHYIVLEDCRFVTSGMLRTEQTLQYLFEDRPHVQDTRFQEIDFGAFEMQGYEELKERQDYQAWISGDNEKNVPPQGESGEQMSLRVLEGLQDLQKQQKDTVLITHGGVIAAIMAHLFPEENKYRYEWQPEPGGGYVITEEGYRTLKTRKTLFNLTTSPDDMDRFSCRDDLLDLMMGFDGVELMHFDEDERGIIPRECVIGVHLSFFPCWLDFWKGNEEALKKEFGSREVWESVYGGSDKTAIIARFRRELKQAHAYGAEYVVFHVSEATIEESFTWKYLHTDEEVIDATIEVLNELLQEEDGSMAFLVENLWQPGLSFTRPEMTRRLLEGIQYPNKGIMLDTGHLLHTNTAIRTQEEGVAYIHQLLDAHGELVKYIRGVHLNQSLTGEYCEKTKSNPPDLGTTYQEKYAKMFWHAFAVDQHLPFTCEGVAELVERMAPEYLTFEFITADSAQHKEYLDAQRKALRMK